jgi:hypothetical protein
VQPPNWPVITPLAVYSNIRRQWLNRQLANSPAGPGGSDFGRFSAFPPVLKTFLLIFVTFSPDSPCKLLSIGTKFKFSAPANLGGNQTLKSPSILSFIKIGSEEMFLSSKEAFLLKG